MNLSNRTRERVSNGLRTFGLVLLIGSATVELAGRCVACTPFQRDASTLAINVATCIVANQDLPAAQIAIKCGVDAAQSDAMHALLSEARAASARKAGCGPSSSTNHPYREWDSPLHATGLIHGGGGGDVRSSAFVWVPATSLTASPQ